MKIKTNNAKGFTIIELLIVIGVLAMVAAILVLLLNPVQLIAQGRDARRLSDIKTLDKAVQLAKAYTGGADNSQPNIVYISLPDTNGNVNDNCIVDYPSLPALSGIWQYRCQAIQADLRKVDGTGWAPVNFSLVSNKPLNVLPVDPVNNSGYFYSYTRTNLATILESDKYIAQTGATDGGTQINYYETAPIAYIGGSGGSAALFAGSDDSIFKCLTSTGCDTLSEWVDVTGASFPAASDFAVDTVNNVIYTATAGNEVYRCVLSTDCDTRAEWVSAFNTGTIFLNSILFDPTTQALYAGGEAGFMYRCATSTGCDGGAAEWPQIMDLNGEVDDIIRDSNNNVLYLNERSTFGGGSIVRRCLTATLCDAPADWVSSFDGTAAGDSLYKMAFDTGNSVIYAAGFDTTGGEFWRCDVTATSCDANGDWTKPYSIGSTNFVSAVIANGVLYVGEDFVDNMDRCPTSSGCDAQTDFTRYSLPGSGTNVYALSFDPVNSVIYAGTGDFGIIYQCLVSSACDAPTDWAIVADTPDLTISEIIYKP